MSVVCWTTLPTLPDVCAKTVAAAREREGGRAGEGGRWWFDGPGGALEQQHACMPCRFISAQQAKTITRTIEWVGIFVGGRDMHGPKWCSQCRRDPRLSFV